EVLVRGPMISSATWRGGKLQAREDDWLATGDLAEREPTGDLKFLGRKSEVIVTAAGLNVHPEDLEAAVENEPGVTGCAVVPVETSAGPEPCAVLAIRGSKEQAMRAIDNANRKLAEFQRIRRWMLWPEPDLPRTSTGKVRRKPVEEWAGRAQKEGAEAARSTAAGVEGAASGDWLLRLIQEISGEAPPGGDDSLRLSEDFHLDSLGRVQLGAALEERTGGIPGGGMLEGAETLGDLRKLVGGTGKALHPANASTAEDHAIPAERARTQAGAEATGVTANVPRAAESQAPPVPVDTMEDAIGGKATRRRYLYPLWPWWTPVKWFRDGFTEVVMQPVTRFLIKPRVVRPPKLDVREPMLIVCNHLTSYDGALVRYALPGPIRRRLAIAMSGEMLEDFRHARVPEGQPRHGSFNPLGPLAYWLATMLFNVFPLP